MARKTPSQDHQRVQSRGDAGEPADHRTASRSASPSPLNHGIDPEAYAVGYRRPPLHGRFQPGRSGNPKGRAKHSPNMRGTVRRVLSEDMKIRVGGRLRRMSTMEALVRTLLARSFKGDSKAVASLIVLMRQSGLIESEEAFTDLLNGPAYDEIIADFRARNGVQDPARDDEVKASGSTNAAPAKRKD
jgi:Family of unknown function (DUF5681)